ncbi:hypothetical protein roselon_00602 [Roseibacterium elongatum DSM 19469]|uniref:Uncharacterized protein n=1 Tax=Roseicyclus elongatus DSM 19469 TaxID=1294273 RepID=W8RYV8_9RHOB|nr:hypothetical protein [Roseibacterium elongatum]AHM03042.1 hypothetical protein roselon_00602 [Roseibacterium elongatum DSM 19469]
MSEPDYPPLPRHTFHATQREADALVTEAIQDDRFAPLPGLPPACNSARIIVGMWYVSGTLSLPRGWVRSVMLAMRAVNAPHPSGKVLRWYRSKLRDSPAYFAGMRGLDRGLLAQIEQDVDVG